MKAIEGFPLLSCCAPWFFKPPCNSHVSRPCGLSQSQSRIGTSLAFYMGSKRPLPRKLQKQNLKRGSWGLSAPGANKLENGSKMTIFQVFFRVLGSFSTIFRPFLEFLSPGPKGSGNPFSDFFSEFPGERPL